MFQRALAVNRIDCRVSLRDFMRGVPILGPLRVPLREAKKLRYALSASRRDCCSTTVETSPSQDRSTVRLASVINRLDSSPAEGNGRPVSRASSRARTASLNTTRAHPNALANALCWPVSGYRRKLYLSCMTITLGTSHTCHQREHADESSPWLPHLTPPRARPAPPERRRDAPRRDHRICFTPGLEAGALRMNPGSGGRARWWAAARGPVPAWRSAVVLPAVFPCPSYVLPVCAPASVRPFEGRVRSPVRSPARDQWKEPSP
jgi:hypothetical protein